MAYGNKYILQFKDFCTNTISAIIKQRDYSDGSSYAKGIGSSPLIHNMQGASLEKFTPVKPSYLQFNLMNESIGQYEELFSEDEQKYYVEATKGSLFFKGFLFQDSYSEEYKPPPYPSSVDILDTLCILKTKYFWDDDSQLYTGVKSLVEIISICLKKCDILINYINIGVNLYEDNHLKTSADCPLKQTYVDSVIFRTNEGNELSCYEVLSRICTVFGARAWMDGNILWIARVIEMTSPFNYRVFNRDGVKLTYVEAHNPVVALTGNAIALATPKSRIDWTYANAKRDIFPAIKGLTINIFKNLRRSIYDYSFFRFVDWYDSYTAVTGWNYTANVDGQGIEPDNETDYYEGAVLCWPMVIKGISFCPGFPGQPAYMQSEQIYVYWAGMSFRLSIKYRVKCAAYTNTGVRAQISITVCFRENGTGAMKYLDDDGIFYPLFHYIKIEDVQPSMEYAEFKLDFSLNYLIPEGTFNIRIYQLWDLITIPPPADPLHYSMELVIKEASIIYLENNSPLENSETHKYGNTEANTYSIDDVNLYLCDVGGDEISEAKSKAYRDSFAGALLYLSQIVEEYLPTGKWKTADESEYETIQGRLKRDVMNQYQYATIVLSGIIKGDGLNFGTIIRDPKQNNKYFMINSGELNIKKNELICELIELRQIIAEYLVDEEQEYILDENGDPIKVFV